MTRTPVCNRRPSECIQFEHQGTQFTGSVSYWPENGRPCEVFLDGGRVGSAVQAVARDSAVAASLALQHGMDIRTLRDALTRDDDGAPAGPLGKLLDMVVGA